MCPSRSDMCFHCGVIYVRMYVLTTHPGAPLATSYIITCLQESKGAVLVSTT